MFVSTWNDVEKLFHAELMRYNSARAFLSYQHARTSSATANLRRHLSRGLRTSAAESSTLATMGKTIRVGTRTFKKCINRFVRFNEHRRHTRCKIQEKRYVIDLNDIHRLSAEFLLEARMTGVGEPRAI